MMGVVGAEIWRDGLRSGSLNSTMSESAWKLRATAAATLVGSSCDQRCRALGYHRPHDGDLRRVHDLLPRSRPERVLGCRGRCQRHRNIGRGVLSSPPADGERAARVVVPPGLRRCGNLQPPPRWCCSGSTATPGISLSERVSCSSSPESRRRSSSSTIAAMAAAQGDRVRRGFTAMPGRPGGISGGCGAVDADRIVILGKSLGGAVAVDLAAEVDTRGFDRRVELHLDPRHGRPPLSVHSPLVRADRRWTRCRRSAAWIARCW